MSTNEKRLIGNLFPIKNIGLQSAREKRISNGHLSTLHVWWARRPLAASRATIYASLVGSPKNIEEWGTKDEFITKLSKWENSTNLNVLDQAINDIYKNFNGDIPKILDPFAGGGSIPLEAVRLGCETHAGDYNPVAVLILKCAIEFPIRFGSQKEKGLSKINSNNLLQDVKQWGIWVENHAKDELLKFYPNSKSENLVGYYWAKTIRCPNPNCGVIIPLISSYWLIKNNKKKIALFPFVSEKKIKFKIVGNGYEKFPENFDPEKGNYSRGTVICLSCGHVCKDTITRKIFQENNSGNFLICKIFYENGKSGKKFKLVSETDSNFYNDSEDYLKEKRKIILEKHGFDPLPTEDTPDGKGSGAERSFGLKNYGMNSWSDLFNSRQNLVMVVISDKIRDAYDEMTKQGYEKDYAKAITTYLALGLDRLGNYNSTLCRINRDSGRVANTFGRHTMRMVPNYVESNPFNPRGASWNQSCKTIESFLKHCTNLRSNKVTIFQSSSTELNYPDNYFDAVITDPPYYDNIAYSYLSDFFYVWLKRILGQLYPELFITPLTPKEKEIVVYANKYGTFVEGKNFFEKMLGNSFSEIFRVLKPDGIAVIVYAHKSTEGWETLISSILESGLIVTASWPIHTEMQDRIRSQDSSALASSIYMIARKWKKEKIGFYRDVRNSLKKHLRARLDNLWNQGILGADFFIAGIGASLEIFGKYEKIIDDNDKPIKVSKLLDDVRKFVSDYTLKQVIENGFSEELSALTRFYVIWRWSYGEAKVPYDDALKLSHGVGVDLVKELNKGFIRKDKEYVEVLKPTERKEKDLKSSKELIDVLHLAVLYWKQNKREDLLQLLSETGYGKKDVFFKVIQAIIDANPGSDETKLLEGFQTGRKRIEEKITLDSKQTKLL